MGHPGIGAGGWGGSAQRGDECGGPSRPQLCAKATPRARRTRCACDPASAAAATAISGPTATPVSGSGRARGAGGGVPEGRGGEGRGLARGRGAGGKPAGSLASARACPRLRPCRVPAPVLGSRLQGALRLPPARAVRGRDGPVYVSRAALGRTLRACVPVPARRVPPAERRVSLRARLVGPAVRQRVLLQRHVALRPADGRVPVPRGLVGPQLQQPVRLQRVAVRAAERPLPVPGAHVRRALRALLPVLPRPLPPAGRHVRVRARLQGQVLPGAVPRRLLRPGLPPPVSAAPAQGREGGTGSRGGGSAAVGPRLASRPFPRCGQCKGQQPCTVAEGRCLTCEPGWNGTKCDQPCAAGFYGEGCGRRCPPCRDGHACNHVTGKCARCNAGWIGDR